VELMTYMSRMSVLTLFIVKLALLPRTWSVEGVKIAIFNSLDNSWITLIFEIQLCRHVCSRVVSIIYGVHLIGSHTSFFTWFFHVRVKKEEHFIWL
jgi:hypothetical protein